MSATSTNNTISAKKALVTGGSGEIGTAICIRLAEQGYHIIIQANTNRDRAEQTADYIRTHGGSSEVVQLDVTSPNAGTSLLPLGPIQVIVHNAGIHSDAPMPAMTGQQWHEVIDISLHGFFNIVQPLLMPMIKTRWGRIIAISSVAGLLGNRGQANYAAAKAGLIGACKSLSQEVAKRNITVNVVAPGIIESKMTENLFSPEKLKQMVPMQRVGTVEEVASAVNFLASAEASYITSQVISVNGGIA